jgi:glycosyltransferase involved in cell wall biosynthesis
MRPFLDSAEVLVAPMRMGRGIQNKVLEGLAMGLPCVTSIAAWNGTVIPQGQGILATDNPQMFAEHVLRLLRDDSYRADMGRNGRLQVEAHYGWDAQLKVLDSVVAQVTSPCRGPVQGSKAIA